MDTAAVDPRWKDLYKIGWITAIILEIVLFLSIAAVFFRPYAPGNESTEGIFSLLQHNPFSGLIALDFLLVLGNLFGLLLFLALYVSLKPVNESYALIALVLGLVAVTWIIPARPISELFTISKLHASALTEATKSQYLAAGEALLAIFDGTSWFMNTLLGGLSLLISAILMLQSKAFSKATAYVGIVTNAAVCGFFIPGIGIPLLLLSLPGYIIWYFQLARTFFQAEKTL